MVMLSEFLRFQMIDSQGRVGKLSDVAIGELDVDYPLVTYLILRPDRQSETVFPWNSVEEIDWRKRQIQLDPDRKVHDSAVLEQLVRLKRDVLDALILDLQHDRVTRANDLWLEVKEKQMRLSAADTGVQAVLRRLTGGRYRGVNRTGLYDWKYVEFLRGDPQAVDAGAQYHRRIVRLPPGEIAHLTAALPYLHAAELLELLPEQLAADTLEVMTIERQLQVFEELDEERALQLLQRMAPDVAADILGRVNTELTRHYLNRLPRESSERIIDLLRYPENTVGGIMSNDVVTLSPKMKISEARPLIREKLKEPDFVYFLYVVEDEEPHKLRGVVSLRQFVMADDDQVIEDIMNPYLMTLSPLNTPDEAGYRLLNSQLAALPVVGGQGQLLGRVTIDAAVSQLAPESWRAQAPRVFS